MELENKIVDMLKTIYDPEIPVDVYELGLIYEVKISPENHVEIDMTLTSQNCPVAENSCHRLSIRPPEKDAAVNLQSFALA